MPIGDQIREARQRAGLSQTALAKRVGVNKNTVSNWETGTTSPKDKIAKVREVLRDTWDEDAPPTIDDEEAWLSRIHHGKLIRELDRRLDAAEKLTPGKPPAKDFLGRPGTLPPDPLPSEIPPEPESGSGG